MKISNFEDLIILKDDKDFELAGKTLIVGWHGLGQTGFLSVQTMVDLLKLKRALAIYSEWLPPYIAIKHGKIMYPVEIYEKDDFLVMVPYFEPTRDKLNKFIYQVLLFLKSEGVKEIIAIGGLDSNLKEESLDLNEEDILENKKEDLPTQLAVPRDSIRVVKNKHFPEDSPLDKYTILDDGLYIAGPLALVLLLSEMIGLPAAGILAYADRERPDPKAALTVLQFFKTHYGFDIDSDKMHEEIDNYEKEINKIIQQSELIEARENNTGMFL